MQQKVPNTKTSISDFGGFDLTTNALHAGLSSHFYGLFLSKPV
jgi:hypothetical protein